MTPSTLWPCAVVLDYRSNFGPHKMTIPLTEWSPVSGGHISGTNLAWDSSQVDTDDMITGLVTLLKPFFYTDTVFSQYTIYTFASVNAPARPKVAQGITGGTGTGGSYNPATQATFNFKTAGFHAFKLVMLDVAAGAQYLPVTAFPSPAYDTTIALRDYIISDANAFSGRDNTQPVTLAKLTYTINEKLRQSYKLD